MVRRWMAMLLTVALGVGAWAESAAPVQAQQYNLNPFWYYPYYYFPHNYWPIMGPKWPEPPGTPYMPPPVYQAYPHHREQGWRYECWEPQSYYRGNHFLLDQF
jgi:hypothetical protein